MPELPEVETVRRDLEAALGGQRVERASVRHPRTVRRQPHEEFVAAIEKRRLVGFRRVGKFLLVDLDDGALLVAHLRMSGAFSLCAPSEPLVAHTHAVLSLSGGDELRFVDPRTFGELFVSTAAPDGRPPELAHLGPDPILDSLGAAQLAAICKGRRTALKAVLLNQSLVAGIGSIYADEICFASGLRPQRVAGTLRRGELDRLATSVEVVLHRAVEARGSTLRDARYVDLSGRAGSYQNHHAVYGRADEPCVVCGTPIARRIVAGRSAHYCPNCQH